MENVERLCLGLSLQSGRWTNFSTHTVSAAWRAIAPCRECSSMTVTDRQSARSAMWWVSTLPLAVILAAVMGGRVTEQRKFKVSDFDTVCDWCVVNLTQLYYFSYHIIHTEGICMFYICFLSYSMLGIVYFTFVPNHWRQMKYLLPSCLLYMCSELSGNLFSLWGAYHRSRAESSGAVFPCSLFPLHCL